MHSRRLPWTLLVMLALPAWLSAGEIILHADRDHLQQGESVTLRLTVRGSKVRPVVTPPTVTYCQLEQVQEMQLVSRAPVLGLPKSGSQSPTGDLSRALGDFDRHLQNLPGGLGNQGLGQSSLLKEYDGMLRDIRRQAREALNQPSGPQDFEAVYRLTPERSGTLELNPFHVKIAGQTYRTKPLTLTISAAARNSRPLGSLAPSGARKPASLPALSGDVPAGFQFQLWHGIVLLFVAPVLGAVVALLGRRWVADVPSTDQESQLREQQAAFAHERVLPELRERLDWKQIEALLAGYVRCRCGLPAGEVTPTETKASLQSLGTPTVLAERYACLLEACSAARFSPSGQSLAADEVAREARLLIMEIEGSQRAEAAFCRA